MKLFYRIELCITISNQQSAISNGVMANHNPKYLIHKKHGFTLVELSIVLVIIGLLISGILVGQSLIESAKTNRLVNDLMQYEVAVVQFHNKFKKYPGDSPHFIPPGNGDNDVDYSGGCADAPNAALSNDEYLQVWAHLSQAGMLSKNYAAYSPTSCAGGVHNNIGSDVSPYTEVSGASAASRGTSKPPIIALKSMSAGNFYFSFYINPFDLLAIENKLGSITDDYTGAQIGLVNSFGAGSCYDGISPLSCTDPSAMGYLTYYLAPP